MTDCAPFYRKWGGSMYSLFFIARNNLKKKKGDVAVLLFLIALAALLLYTSMSVLTGTPKIIQTAYENADTADFFFMTNVDNAAQIREILTSQEEVTKYEESDCLYLDSANYRKDQSEEKQNFALLVNAMDEERSISKVVGIETKEQAYGAILLPYYLKAAEGYETGDSIYLTLGSCEYKFTVAGFVEDPLFATPLNISVYSVYITREYMENIKENSKENYWNTQYKVKLQEGESTYAFEQKVSAILTKEIPGLADSISLGINADLMKGGDQIMTNISMSIILVFSVLLVLVSLIIIRFSIRSFMEMNLKNIGILEASGYTVKQLRLVSAMEMGMLALGGSVVGIFLGSLGSQMVGRFQGMMTGIRWNQGFQPDIAILVVLGILLVVLGVTGIVSMAYRKITVLDALRSGIHNHNFRRNHFPLEKSRMPLSLVISGKNIMGEKGKNLSILCIIILLSLTSYAGFALYQNFALDKEYVIKLSGLEAGDISITGNDLEAVGKEMESWEAVGSVLYFNSFSVKLSNGSNETTITCDVWEDPALVKNETIIEGRLPQYENEIVLTTVIAEEFGLEVGDVIYAEASGEKLPCIISGIDQKISNMGRKSMMTSEGATQLNGGSQALAVYVYLNDGFSYDDVASQIEEQFPEVHIMDSKQYIEGVTSGVAIGMKLICVVFVLITVLVVFMVEMLLVKAKVIKEQKNYGISKAVGYTTKQLMIQTMMMNMPVIALGSVIGATAGVYLISPLTSMCLSMLGIRKCELSTAPGWLLFDVVGIIAIAAVVSFLASVRIRRIEPVRMLVEE